MACAEDGAPGGGADAAPATSAVVFALPANSVVAGGGTSGRLVRAGSVFAALEKRGLDFDGRKWIFTDILSVHSMHPFAHLTITPELLRLVSELDEFKGRWQAIGNLAPERLAVLRRIATIESVASSTRIEGAQLTDQQVEHLLSGLGRRSFASRDEEEVAGYADVMGLVFGSWLDMLFTENVVKQLHGLLLRHSSKDERHCGKYKTIANHVEAFDATGMSLGVVFQTTTPFDTPRHMEALVTWTNDALRAGEYHSLLVIAVFVVRFLGIHPFQDGNGRLSRVLTTLLLLRAGYAYVPYSSLERVVEENKETYYLALRRAQGTLDRGEAHLGDWLLFFLRSLKSQKDALERKIARERIMVALSPLAEQLLRIVREHGRLTVRDAVAFSGANRNTVKAQLRVLVDAHQVELHGKARGTWYGPA